MIGALSRSDASASSQLSPRLSPRLSLALLDDPSAVESGMICWQRLMGNAMAATAWPSGTVSAVSIISQIKAVRNKDSAPRIIFRLELPRRDSELGPLGFSIMTFQ
jgi:hypothetical protein